MNDNAFVALANEHRRKLLVALLEESPRDETIHRRTDGGSGATEHDHLQIATHHEHLPRLVDYGFIDWDEERNEISKGPQFEELRPLLEFVADHPKS